MCQMLHQFIVLLKWIIHCEIHALHRSYMFNITSQNKQLFIALSVIHGVASYLMSWIILSSSSFPTIIKSFIFDSQSFDSLDYPLFPLFHSISDHTIFLSFLSSVQTDVQQNIYQSCDSVCKICHFFVNFSKACIVNEEYTQKVNWKSSSEHLCY